MKFLVLLGTCCFLFAATSGQLFNPNRGLNDLPNLSNPYRRQLSSQQHILTDVQQHHTLQQRQAQNQQYFLQPSPSNEVPVQYQQKFRPQPPTETTRFGSINTQGRSNFLQAENSNTDYQQQNYQFPRSTQNQLYTPQQQQQPQQQPQQQQLFRQPQFQQQPQQQPPLDQHTQNFLTLRNYGQQQQVGPQQGLPQRSFSNKPFQQQQQYQTLPSSAYQQQQQQQYPVGPQQLPQTQQKLPQQSAVPTFQTLPAQQQPQQPPQRPFATSPDLIFQQQRQQQLFPQTQQQLPLSQQEHQFQVTPNLGLPVPQIFPHLQSTAFPQQLQKQQFAGQQQQQNFQQTQQQQQPNPDQEYKQKLIQKHEQFVQKQYEKTLKQVRQQHEEFLAKQQAIKQQVLPTLIAGTQQQQYYNPNQIPSRGRPVVDPNDVHHFSNALQKYNEEHPTTTTTTTTTTTEAPTTIKAAPPKNVYAQVKAELGKFGTKTASASKKPAKTIARDELLKQLKAALAEAPQKQLGNKTYDEMDLVLPNGQHVQVIRTTDPNLVKGQQSFSQEQFQELLAQQALGQAPGKLSLSDVAPDSSKDLVLPNGSKVQISRSPNNEDIDPQQLPGGVDLSNLASLYGGDFAGVSNGANSIASSAVISSDSDEPPTLEELAKRGLIPDGYEIEGLSSSSAKPKPKPTAAPKKKATYVYLEEQADGSFKIQGVKANGERETKQSGAEVESILERIRTGDIKLPPTVQRLTLPNDEVVEIKSGKIIKTLPSTTTTTTSTSTTTTTTTTTSRPTLPPLPTYSHRQYHPSRSTPFPQTSTRSPLLNHRSSTVYQQDSAASSPYHTTASPVYRHHTVAAVGNSETESDNAYAGGVSTHEPVTERLTGNFGDQTAANVADSAGPYTDTLVQESENNEKATEHVPSTTADTTSSTSPQLLTSTSSTNPSEDLIQILKSNGLFAMAKYLRQSGLDSILNETGPYTLFVPTDKAFKNLLVQLGGPERAEEKFKANPRLLSGLLLHHVIPGSFEIATLQDEMTGVSLAGTQLRVNQYVMHDQEWNDVTLTTINGAMVVLNKKDIKIPQGIAHAVDRVMFPLPVGDLLQTLQSDRENRFSNFLKILYTSGLSEKLQSKGIKTYTVFAPIDKSFNDIEPDVLEKLLNDKAAAEEFAMKHIVPGALFSAGMRFYQVKDSLLTGKTVILQKTSAGKIKVNDAQMVTSNIPATNGVIHALDGALA